MMPKGARGCVSSGIKAVGVQPICNQACFLTGVTVTTDGTNDATLKLFDSGANAESGTQLEYVKVPGASQYGGRDYSVPKSCANGITANLAGVGSNCIVDYVIK